MSEVTVEVGFGDFFSVCTHYDKCRLLYEVSDVMTYVCLSFDFTEWFVCGIRIDVLFQKVILSVRFFNLFTDNMVYVSIVVFLCSSCFLIPLYCGSYLVLLRDRC